MNNSDYALALEFAMREARRDFATYLRLFRPRESGFIFNRVHQYLARLVQDVADGTRGKRQAVSVSPQTGKSTLLTIEATSWILGRFPGKQIAITGFSHDLMTDFSKAVKDRIEHPLYARVFPDCHLIEGSNRADLWELSNGSKLTAKSVGKKLTGRRVDWLIVDDPHAGREEAESSLLRKRVQRWFEADCVSRLSPEAAVFLTGTRWHPDDLIGYLTSEEKVSELRAANADEEVFEVTNLPAVCERPENDPLGRQEGEALFPELRGIDFLKKVRASLPAYEWRSQYQGEPRSVFSGTVETSNLQFIARDELPEGLEYVRAWDLALTESQSSDYSAGALTSYDGLQDRLFIVDMVRLRKPWTKLRSLLLAQAEMDRETYDVQRIGIEAVAGFLAIFQDVHNALLGESKVEKRIPPRGGKLLRAQPWLNKTEARRVFIVRGAWNKDFIAELETFPNGDHDDQVDAISTAWEMLTGRNRNGILPPVPKRPQQIVRPKIANRPHGGPRPYVPWTPQSSARKLLESFIS